MNLNIILHYLTEDEIQIEILKDKPEDSFRCYNCNDDPDFIYIQESLDTEGSE